MGIICCRTEHLAENFYPWWCFFQPTTFINFYIYFISPFIQFYVLLISVFRCRRLGNVLIVQVNINQFFIKSQKIMRYLLEEPTREVSTVTSFSFFLEVVYWFLTQAKENTANQKPGKPLQFLRYAMGNLHRVLFLSAFPSWHAHAIYFPAILYFRKHYTVLILLDLFFIYVDCIRKQIFWFHFVSYLYLYFILQNWVWNDCQGKTCSLAHFVAVFYSPDTWDKVVMQCFWVGFRGTCHLWLAFSSCKVHVYTENTSDAWYILWKTLFVLFLVKLINNSSS